MTVACDLHNLKFHFTTRSRGQQIVCTSTVPMCIFEEDTQDKLACLPLGGKTYVLVGQNNVLSRRQRDKGLCTFQPHRSTLWPRGNVPIVEIPLRKKFNQHDLLFHFSDATTGEHWWRLCPRAKAKLISLVPKQPENRPKGERKWHLYSF